MTLAVKVTVPHTHKHTHTQGTGSNITFTAPLDVFFELPPLPLDVLSKMITIPGVKIESDTDLRLAIQLQLGFTLVVKKDNSTGIPKWGGTFTPDPLSLTVNALADPLNIGMASCPCEATRDAPQHVLRSWLNNARQPVLMMCTLLVLCLLFRVHCGLPCAQSSLFSSSTCNAIPPPSSLPPCYTGMTFGIIGAEVRKGKVNITAGFSKQLNPIIFPKPNPPIQYPKTNFTTIGALDIRLVCETWLLALCTSLAAGNEMPEKERCGLGKTLARFCIYKQRHDLAGVEGT